MTYNRSPVYPRFKSVIVVKLSEFNLPRFSCTGSSCTIGIDKQFFDSKTTYYFPIIQFKHMFCMLKRTLRQFFFGKNKTLVRCQNHSAIY